MKVILQKDVKNLGQVGDIVSVKKGYARYFLFPNKLAMIFTEVRRAEVKHRQTIIEFKKKKALQDRQTLVEKLKGVSLYFDKQADIKGQLFGSVNAFEISKKLEERGYSIDKKLVQMPSSLKEVGSHKVILQWDSETRVDIEVVIKSSSSQKEILKNTRKKKESEFKTKQNQIL